MALSGGVQQRLSEAARSDVLTARPVVRLTRNRIFARLSGRCV